LTTFALARRSKEAKAPHGYSGAILLASGVMYFRFLALIAFFSSELMHRLLLPFLILGAIGVAGGWAWSNLPDNGTNVGDAGYTAKNPLELTSAFSLAIVFVAMLVATNFALVHLGRGGMYGLAVLSGLAPVDPFIMGLTQTAGKLIAPGLATAGIVVAAASNNFAKALIAIALAESKTGRQSLVLLLGLTVLGLLPLLWVAR
jgi:uncharacterized membrane protein (DUF4010 family)